MAAIEFDIDDSQILDLLRKNHALREGDAVERQTQVEFDYEPATGNTSEHHYARVTLTYDLTPAEVEKLVTTR